MRILKQKNSRRYRFIKQGFVPLAILCLVLIIGGCGLLTGGDEESAEQKPGAVSKKVLKKKVPAGKSGQPSAKKPAGEEPEKLTLEKLEQQKEAREREYIFNPEKMLDPFRPIEAVIAARSATSDTPKAASLPPLQKMELSQLKLVAVVMAGNNTRALVEDSTGMGYIISLGTRMGTRRGQVKSILPDKVEVVEDVQDFRGIKKTRVSVIKLKPIEGEKK
ncbi:MAG: pilus assembly protein PilP [Thermodesulfobacteriota bacterium]|nr:pilus assembly protein PilP [Thermodesulfobacteriota bacterium]